MIDGWPDEGIELSITWEQVSDIKAGLKII